MFNYRSLNRLVGQQWEGDSGLLSVLKLSKRLLKRRPMRLFKASGRLKNNEGKSGQVNGHINQWPAHRFTSTAVNLSEIRARFVA